MKARIRHLSELLDLRESLARDAREVKLRLDEAARQAAARAEHEANLFRTAVGAIEPLKAPARVQHNEVAARPDRPSASSRRGGRADRVDLRRLRSRRGARHRRAVVVEARDASSPEVVRKLRRGHWIVQAEVDLHGARVDGAREMVADFLRDAVKHRLRCVRIVHGKGHGSVGRQPVLKGKVKAWLTQKDEVMAFCQAREHDGGGGALIVLLRPS